MWRSAPLRRTPLRPGDKPPGRKARTLPEPQDRPKNRLRPVSEKRAAKLLAEGRLASISRKTRIKTANRERLTRLRRIQFGPQADLCRRSACFACGKPGPSDPHHEPPRSCGGTDQDTVPLCKGLDGCHRKRHSLGLEPFQAAHKTNLLLGVQEMRERASVARQEIR